MFVVRRRVRWSRSGSPAGDSLTDRPVLRRRRRRSQFATAAAAALQAAVSRAAAAAARPRISATSSRSGGVGLAPSVPPYIIKPTRGSGPVQRQHADETNDVELQMLMGDRCVEHARQQQTWSAPGSVYVDVICTLRKDQKYIVTDVISCAEGIS